MATIVDNKDGTSTVTLEFTAKTDDLNSMFDLIYARSTPNMGLMNQPPRPLPDGKGGWILPDPVEPVVPTDDEKVVAAEAFVWDTLANMARQYATQQQMQEAQAAIAAGVRDLFPRIVKGNDIPIEPVGIKPINIGSKPVAK